MILFSVLLGIQLGLVPTAHAAAPAEVCRNRMLVEFTDARDKERAALFGARKGSDGSIYVLTGGSGSREVRGIFESKGRLTSELVDPVVESYRTYRCKMASICTVLQKSFREQATMPQSIDVLGCEQETLPLYNECFFGDDGDATKQKNTVSQIARLTGECREILDQSLVSERALLRMATAYDAGYRSMLQYAGIMDWMLEHLSDAALRPIREMVNLLGKLHTIPCFIGQCDLPPTDPDHQPPQP